MHNSNNKHYVFISYSSKEKNIANAVCNGLETNRIKCWIAPRDITPGNSYGQDIIDGIGGASIFLLIFSENSQNSVWVKKETERAISKGLIIIPFRIENILPSKEMEFYISNAHWLDAYTEPLEDHIQNLIGVVRKVLKIYDTETGEAILIEPAVTTGSIFDDERQQPKQPGNQQKPGNINYSSVTIGNQVWMAENLNVDTFRNGDPIPQAKTHDEWEAAGEQGKPAWCYYNNDLENGKKYGKLYNWYAVNDPRGLAPDGWYIPSIDDWCILEEYFGDRDGFSNMSVFYALLGGYRGFGGSFLSIDELGEYWSSIENSAVYAGCYIVLKNSLSYNANYKKLGLSVRCLRNIGDTSIKQKWKSFSPITKDDEERLFNKPCLSSLTFRTAKIGNQEWMTKNLNVDTFRNGDLIPHAYTLEEWEAAGKQGKPAWCYYNNDPENGKMYGKLYNLCAVKDPRGLAPKGWHIPSSKEWAILVDYLGGKDEAGSKLKSNIGWGGDGNGINDFGFSAFPGGARWSSGSFLNLGYGGRWWSASSVFGPTFENENPEWFTDGIAAVIAMSAGHSRVLFGKAGDNKYGFSVRCLRGIVRTEDE